MSASSSTEQHNGGGVEKKRLSGVSNNPFMLGVSMQKEHERKRRNSTSYNSIGNGRISDILTKWNQQLEAKKRPVINPSAARPSKTATSPVASPSISNQTTSVTSNDKDANDALSAVDERSVQTATDVSMPSVPSEAATKSILAQKHKELRMAQLQLSNYASEADALQQQNETLQTELKRLQNVHTSVNDEHYGLKQKVTKLRRSVRAIESDKRLKEIQHKALQDLENQQLAELRQQLNALQAQKREKQSSSSYPLQNEEELQQQLAAKEHEINQAHHVKQGEISNLTQQNSRKDHELQTYGHDINKRQRELQREKNKVDELEQKLAQKQTSDESSSSLSDARIDELNGTIVAVAKAKDEKILALNESIQQIDDQMKDFSVTINEFKQRNEELNEQNDTLMLENAELEEKQTEMMEILHRIRALEEENKRLREENSNAAPDQPVPTEWENRKSSIGASTEEQRQTTSDVSVYVDGMDNDNDIAPEEDHDDGDNAEVLDSAFFNMDDDDEKSMQGWIEKQSKFLKKWKKRYVRIEDGYLSVCHDQKQETDPLLRIDYTVLELVYNAERPREFVLKQKANDDSVESVEIMHVFRCRNETETQKWMDWLNEVKPIEKSDTTPDEVVQREESEANISDTFEHVENVDNVLSECDDTKSTDIDIVQVETVKTNVDSTPSEAIGTTENEAVKTTKKKKKKVHKLAAGLNIPMGGLLGGPPPSLMKS